MSFDNLLAQTDLISNNPPFIDITCVGMSEPPEIGRERNESLTTQICKVTISRAATLKETIESNPEN